MYEIPYGRQSICEEDIKSILEVLSSDWLTQGPTIEEFEKSVAGLCGAKHAVAVTNATSALHIACLSLGLGPGDVLWTTPNTFVASANCALYCGAMVDFVDIDPRTYNMDVSALEIKLKNAKTNGKIPKVVIPVHFAGQPCQMDEIKELAQEYGFKIIEDASHAVGARYKNTKIGSCSFSDLTVFSFHPVKIITTGEGGMVLTNNGELYEKLLLLRSHGITRTQQLMNEESHGPWYYQQITLGYNYRMTDIQAALGISQLNRLELFIKKRNEIAKNYNIELEGLPLTLPWQHYDTYSSYHLYVVRLKLELLKKTRKEIFNELRDSGINVNLHYIPVHTQPYFKQLGFKQGDFPVAEKYYQEAITLPIFYSLKEDEQNYIINTLRKALG